jgi:hypothetical protein
MLPMLPRPDLSSILARFIWNFGCTDIRAVHATARPRKDAKKRTSKIAESWLNGSFPNLGIEDKSES